jgi:mRNA interferase RelE/StbE
LAYRLALSPAARRDLDSLDRTMRVRIEKRLAGLIENPRPLRVKKLRGLDRTYRIRESDYRIIYEIRDRELLILVIRIGHRRDVYRD